MSVSIAEIVAAARQGQASLVCESAGYIVLGLADAAARSPRDIAPTDVGIDEQGDGTCAPGAAPAPDEVAERRIRRLLGWLLAEARTPSPNLARVAERAGTAGLSHLVVELEAALVPVNRKAARRSLARLFRETTRALERGVAVATDFEAEPSAAASAVPTNVEQEAPSTSGRRESLPPEPMKTSAVDSGPRVVTDGRFDALRKLHALRVDAHDATREEDLDVPVEVELAPLELSVVAPRVAPIEEPSGTRLREAVPDSSPGVELAVQEVSPAFVDTTPTQVLSRVAPRKPEAHLNLLAPTPVTSVASAPVRDVDFGDPMVGEPVTSDDVVSDVEVAPDADMALAQPLESERVSSAPLADVLEERAVLEAPLHDTDGMSCTGVPAAAVTLAPPEPPPRSPSEAPHRPNDVNDLLARFGSAPRRSDRELLRGLERLAGVDAGPGLLESDTEERLRPSPVVAVR